jgi:hypothetical protein
MSDFIKAATFRTRIVANQAHQCAVPRCGQHRKLLSQYCAQHRLVYQQRGHPEAMILRPYLWREQRLRVRQLFEAQSSHPGLVNMLAYLKEYLEQASRSDAGPRPPAGASELARLVRHGVTPLDVLIEACACRCWLFDNPNAAPDTKSTWVAVARAVLHLAPMPRRAYRPSAKSSRASPTYARKARPTDIRAIADHLRSLLPPLVANVYTALQQRDQHKAAALEAIRQPFAPPIAVLISESLAEGKGKA